MEWFLKVARGLEGRGECRWQPFLDIQGRIENPSANALCLFNACDPLFTRAVDGIEPDGSDHVCERQGEWMKAGQYEQSRSEILRQTPQDLQGCKGCRFFPICTGGCPGEAGDWRNRTVHCPTLRALFRFYEDKKLDRDFRTGDKQPEIPKGGHGDVPHGDSHGDHYDASRQGN